MGKYGYITMSHEITDEDIDNTMDAAMAGIAYWASDLDYAVEPAEKVPAMSHALTKGGVLSVRDDDGKKHRITAKTIVKGLKKYGKQDLDDFDSVDADQVVQLGIFGEVVYG